MAAYNSINGRFFAKKQVWKFRPFKGLHPKLWEVVVLTILEVSIRSFPSYASSLLHTLVFPVSVRFNHLLVPSILLG